MKDGWYKVTYPTGDVIIRGVKDGVDDTGTGVAALIEFGIAFEPVVVMTQLEFDIARDDAYTRGLQIGNENGYEYGFNAGQGLKG